MFNHHLRMLSFIPRWQIAPRFRTQSVAEHSYYVALYTMQLLAYKPTWGEYLRAAAMEWALLHDAPEARNGDMPGPVKRAVVDHDRMATYEAAQMLTMGLSPKTYDEEVIRLVKVADLID